LRRRAAGQGHDVQQVQVLIGRKLELPRLVDEADDVHWLRVATLDHHHVAVFEGHPTCALLGRFDQVDAS
jgi:hypothetical protein